MNKPRLLTKLCLLVVFLWSLFTYVPSHGQDLHLSQFYHSPQNINPALTGIFAGDQRFIANYRNQWSNVPVGYMTFSGAYDRKFFSNQLPNSVFGGGVIFNYDQAGDTRLNLTQLGISGSYTHRLGRQHFLSLGVLASFAQRSFEFDNITTNSQFNSDQFVATLPTGEEDVFFNEAVFYADFTVGLNYHFQLPKKRTKFDVGAALFHVNEPLVNFFGNEEVALSKVLNLFADATIKVADRVDVLGRIAGQIKPSTTEKEFIAGIAGRLHLEKDRNYNDVALQLGLNYRFHDFADALIPNLEIHYNKWLFGISYDINISEFDIATRGFGGPEFAVIYKIFKVKDLPLFKNCPIF